MNPSLINAWSGMNAIQTKIDTISNNIANVDTVGYKRREVSFQDVLTNRLGQSKHFELPGRVTPLGLTQGLGARVGLTQLILTQGTRKDTGSPLDLMIEGDGFFEVATRVDGELTQAWTRDGAFQVSYEGDTGYLTTKRGDYVLNLDGERIEIPNGSRVTIDDLGRIYATPEDEPNGPLEQVDALRIVRILRPQALEQMGDNMYRLSAAAQNQGDVARQVDMEDTQARQGLAVRSGALESSNVDMAQEMTELMIAQRAYQMNARAIQSTDTMMGLVNNLRG
jgi:flagellar basal-body rod protein FlgG